MFYDSAEVYQHVYTSIYGDNLNNGNKKNLGIIEAQIVRKPKNNEPRPKFTGSYKNEKRLSTQMCCYRLFTKNQIRNCAARL